MRKQAVKSDPIDHFDREFSGDTFEQYMLGMIFMHLVNSKFLQSKPVLILGLFILLVGEESAEKVFRQYKNAVRMMKMMQSNNLIDRIYPINNTDALEIAKKSALPIMQEVMRSMSREKAENESILYGRVQTIRQRFDLGEIETDMLMLIHIIRNGAAKELFSNDHRGYDFESVMRFKTQGCILLGIQRVEWLRTFCDISKKNYSPIKITNNHIDIDEEINLFLSGMGGDEFKSHYYTDDNDERLSIDDFGRRKEERAVLEALLTSNSSCNILLYGAPGAGKTSFGRALVKHVKKELLTVRVPDEDGRRNFANAVGATVLLANAMKSVILVDEADEMLNSRDSFFFKGTASKSWVNNLLDSHGKKVLWIVNRTSEIDPSSMRRFDITLEFKDLSESKRITILERELRQRGLTGKVPLDQITNLCRTFSVNADGILKAVNLIDWEQEKDPIFALEKVRCILENHEKAMGKRIAQSRDGDRFTGYSMESLNTSANLPSVVTAIQKYAGNDLLSTQQPFTMLLYGMPGTGKTAFVNYLGHLLEKKVILKRASDILSRWVGGTEENIASAFEAAKQDDGILFFDEADSFLYPRHEAVRSWEKTQTNELLTQLESASGIVIFATNFMDGLDRAALRRFRYKIEFKELSLTGILSLYTSMLLPLMKNKSSLSGWVKGRLGSLQNLTPGDFKVVRDQFQFEPEEITHAKLIAALAQETSYKQNNRKMIGFRPAV